MTKQTNTRRILIFIIIAFGIPWVALLVISLAVRTEDLVKVSAAAGLLFGLSPALANVATRLITKEGWGDLWLRPNFRRGWQFYLAACLLPIVAVIVGGGIFFLLFPHSFDPSLSQVREVFANRLFLGNHPWAGMLVNTMTSMLIGVVLGFIYFGEEFGWRAYLLPKLVEHFASVEPGSSATSCRAAAGARTASLKASLLVGLIWGMWHWPGQFLSMKLDPTIPILFPLVFLVSTCVLSVLLCWLTLRSGSIWPASIGHGVINQVSTLARTMMKGPAMLLLGPGPSGLIGGLGYLALALALLLSRRAFACTADAGEKAVGLEVGQAAAITHPG